MLALIIVLAIIGIIILVMVLSMLQDTLEDRDKVKRDDNVKRRIAEHMERERAKYEKIMEEHKGRKGD